MFQPILEHVNEGSAHLEWGPNPPRVIPISPHGPSPAEHAVHGLRHPDWEPLAPARESSRPLSLDQEMHVIRLDAEMKYPEARAGGRGEGAADGVEDPSATQ
jgi:hypothetical protein